MLVFRKRYHLPHGLLAAGFEILGEFRRRQWGFLRDIQFCNFTEEVATLQKKLQPYLHGPSD